MDPNQRLQVLQASSPSLRVATAPAQSISVAQPSSSNMNISVGNAPTRSISVPGFTSPSGAGPDPTSSNFALPQTPATPQAPHSTLGDIMDGISNFAAGANQAALGGGIKEIANLANFIGSGFNAGEAQKRTNDFLHSAGLTDQNGNFASASGADQNSTAFKAGQVTGNVGKAATDVGLSVIPGMAAEKFLSGTMEANNILQGANTASNIARGTIAGVGGSGVSSAIMQAEDPSQNAGQNFGINAALAAGGPLASGILRNTGLGQKFAGAFNSIADKVTGNSGKLADAVASATNPQTIQDALGVAPEMAHYLANETDPTLIKNVLSELGVDTGKKTIRALADAQPEQQGDTIPMLDPMNPTQSQLPGGWHPDGAPDPVPALENVARQAKTADDFKTYVNGLTGEEKAGVTSALNGMTPEEFYSKAGGGTSIPTEAQTPTKLPPEDQAAIQAAGGTAPQMSIPELSRIAQNSFENAPIGIKPGGLDRAAGEIDNGTAKPIRYRTTPEGNTVIEDGRHRLEAARKNGVTDFPAEDVTSQYSPKEAPKDTTATDGTALPAEDVAAIKAAGADVPQPVANAVASQAAPEAARGIAPADQAVEDAKKQVLDTLRSGQPTRQYNQAAAQRSIERGSRSAAADAAYEAAGGGEAGMRAKLSTLKGEYSKSEFGIDMTPETQATLLDHIQANDSLKPFEKVNAQTALYKLANNGSAGPTPFDINILRKALGNDVGDAIEESVNESKSTMSKVANGLGQVAGLPKSVMASFDLSGTLRQGGVLAGRYPAEAAHAFKQQLKYFASEDAFKQGMAEISARPSYQAMLDSKLAVTGTEGLDKSEEQFMSNLAEKIPGVGRGIAASDRAYTGYLTQLRADVFDKTLASYEAAGKPLSAQAQADVAKFINTATGRGDLGKYLEQHSQSLSTALFSPRLWKSRLDLLNPIYYAKLSGPARNMALQTAGTFAAEASTVLGLASMVPGVSVEMDPRSSDFAKIKINNTRYDILGGLQQNIVFAAREITGQTKNATTGEITQLGQKFGGPDRLSIAGDMIQNKENPLLSAASQLLRGKDRGGNPVDPFSTVAQLLIPLPFSGAVQSANDIGSATNPADLLKGVAMNLPDTFGISTQTYGNIPTKDVGNPDANNHPTYNGPIDPNMVTDYSGKAILDKNGKPVKVQFPNGASDLTKQAMLDNARQSATKDQYVRTLPQETQELMKLPDEILNKYVKSGTITQDTMDNIKNYQKLADNAARGNDYKVPAGVTSPQGVAFFQKYNSMDAKQQKAWLKSAPDQNATDVANALNSQKSAGLPDFKPSNQLSQLYANYEKDIGTNPDYTAIDVRQKARAFQSKATQLNYSENVQDLYNAGGSADVKTLIANNKISQQDLNDAINLDNQLYGSGIESSMKFSKTFRKSMGFDTPAAYGSSGGSGGGGSSSHYNQRLGGILSNLPANIGMPAMSGQPGTGAASGPIVPKFSAAQRQSPATTIKFQAPSNVTPAKGSTRITAGPFRTYRTTTLRNSVSN